MFVSLLVLFSPCAETGFLAPVLLELDTQGGLEDVVGGLIDSLNAQLGVRDKGKQQ